MRSHVSVALPTPQATAATVFDTALFVRLLMALVLLAGVWSALLPFEFTPAVIPAHAPATQFSAERAMQDLTVIAAHPHPIGSPRNAEVRAYLMEQIRALGLAPQVQEATLTNFSPADGAGEIIAVQNVLVRLPGSRGGQAVLISGHYDSVPTTTGAGDCGGCVVTTLEALRAIQAGPPLQNDVIFLFTDGEEVGVAGAEAFMAQHPWAEDVGLTLVFEGLGTHGASVLYVTGDNSGGLIGETLEAASYPLAYSFMNDLMWRLARNTGSDLDAFIANGQPGLAFLHLSLDAAVFYHTMGDNLQNLRLGTLQSHGTYAVDLLRHFGNVDLATLPRTPNAVYFNVLPRLAVHYASALALPFAGLALLLFIAVVSVGLRRRQISAGGILIGALSLLLSLVVAVILVTLGWWLTRWLNPNLHLVTVGGWYAAPLYLLAFVALALCVASGLHVLWRRRFRLMDLAAGALVWWVLVALLTSTGLIGFSYIFVWPLLAVLLALGWTFWRRGTAQRPWVWASIWMLPTLIALILVTPLIYVLAIYMGRMEALLGLPSMALPIPVVVLLFGLLLPVAEFLAPARRVWLPMGALLASVALLLTATALSGFDAAQPRTNTMIYWLDAGQNRARWITLNDSRAGRGTSAQLDEWTRQFFTAGVQETTFNPWVSGWFRTEYPALEAAAPLVDLPSSSLAVLSDETTGAERRLRLHIEIHEAVQNAQIILAAPGPIGALTANGAKLDLGAQPAQKIQINVLGRQTGGVTLDLTVPATGPLDLTVQDRILGLPEVPGLTITPRPNWMIPSPWNDSADSTFVYTTFELAPGETARAK